MEDPAPDIDIAPYSASSSSGHLRRRISVSDHDRNAQLHSSSSRPAAAVMPDAPAPAAPSDPDTCRICRGEATPNEPLFYPCKCSGSIKYVHQDCLMEWLSHSQKKHCELCKTPFRFTKLYAPDMPRSLPFYVFVSHFAKYLFRNFLVWARALLVITVWLCWLPYLMRSVWSFLFWISDEGLGGGQGFFTSQNDNSSGHAFDTVSMSTLGTTVCPSSPLFAATTTAAALGNAGGGGASDVVPHIVKSLYRLNLTSIDPLPTTLLRFIFGAVGKGDSTSTANASNLTQGPAPSIDYPNPPTLLSDVRFLHMTNSPTINLGLIAVLEGQIITVLVIICFILIILVRDYVVQQQPEINMRAAFAAAENVAPPQPPDVDPGGLREEDIDNLRGPSDSDNDGVGPQAPAMPDDTMAGPGAGETEAEHAFGPVQGPRFRTETGPEDRTLRGDAAEDEGSSRPISGRTSSTRSDRATRTSLENLGQQPSSSNPSLRSTDSPRPGIQSDGRTRVPVAEGSTVHEYLRIYREAGGDPEKILEIAKEENLEDKLAYWIRLTQSMVERSRPNDGGAGGGEASASASSRTETSALGQPSDAPHSGTSGSSNRSSEWELTEDVQSSDSGSADKGKGKASAEEESAGINNDLHPYSSTRPRSNTDSPRKSDAADMLGNNNWTFSNLSSDEGELNLAGPSSEHPSQNPPVEETEESRSWEYASPPSSTLAESRPPSLSDGIPRVPVPHEIGSIHGGQLVLDTTDTPAEAGSEIQEAPAATEWENLPDINELEAVRRPAVDAAHPQQQQGGLSQRVADFMWGNVDAIDPGELPPLVDGDNDFADHEDPFAILAEDPAAEEVDRDREVVEAAAAAGLDAEAIEDAEDLEGIMELIGMRGPVAGLFQNAIFCAFLVSISIFVGVFLPYNIGRSAVWLVANPMRPVRILFSISKFVQDLALVIIGSISCALISLVDVCLFVLRWNPVSSDIVKSAAVTSWNMSSNAATRIVDSFTLDLPPISAGEIRNFSAVSHEALLVVKGHITSIFASVGSAVAFFFGGNYSAKATEAMSFISEQAVVIWHVLKDLPAHLSDPGSWVIDLNRSETVTTINNELASWSAMDRTWAILGGYLSIFFIAWLYLRRGSPFSRGQAGQEWEASVIDGLNQASGVMKVILIIGIEMLIFPLYCGLLLDIALLPLFESTSVMSRCLFTVNYPLTSIFVHWFVGTGYMFHFALFVSMCRKIMRKGVLYFIRDPDDPEFHPVRDVLERNVTTQLRKILFSAFVYGALVIICLGGVVWGLAYSLPTVLPIHYSSNEPVLEFPIDLLFYNFLMPLAVKFFKPSDGLHAMYTWWFRKCARALRISWFLFGERRIDEEGTLALAPDSPHHKLAWWKRQFLELNDEGEVVPKTWKDTFEGGKAKPTSTIASDDMIRLNVRKMHLVQTDQLKPDGRFVRSPASDQVKIPKGRRVFLDVSENNLRTDGRADRVETDLYSTNQYQFVYIPPHFRVRVFLFIMFIWIFAAVTGVGFTIIPLAFGRQMFHLLIPAHIRTNDIYAFSIGIYLLGSLAYSIVHIQSLLKTAGTWARNTVSAMLRRDAVRRVARVARHGAKLVYTYLFLLILFPLMVSSLMELYLLIPLDTYMYSSILSSTPSQNASALGIHGPRHTIRVIQSWTIGVLYLKLGARMVASWYRDARMTAAIRAVLRRGYLEPDVSILTRAFVVPGVLLWLVAVCGPLVSARVLINYGFVGTALDNDALVLIYRLSFPVAAMAAVAVYTLWSMFDVFKSWRVRIRDEAYLIGERLHNFGVGTVNTRARARDAWRAGGTRL